MNVELEAGDGLTLTTPNGSIAIAADADGYTIVTITHTTGHTVAQSHAKR